ncbi:pPIWI_RE module domain-containing protein [Kribbella solani]|uniref:DUF3893 domain-containing protein n=1 Tax=Kribbella solani TaxID=236067 RepID=A0A841DPS3_9ACTN|nr:DUF3962 domain-containing protein [Kribbella solani]MBB5979839.1 hypothetical protein [Kribbella solani]
MPRYSAIRLSAFEPDRAGDRFVQEFQSLTFPDHWRKDLLDFYRIGRTNPDNLHQVPIKRLNEVLRAVAPQLVCVARSATVADDEPWLYARERFPRGLLLQLVRAWIRDLHTPRQREEYPELLDAAIALDEALGVDELEWQPTDVDLLGRDITLGDTADPHRRLYQLLPDVIAQQVVRLEPYTFEGVQLSFRIASTARGAELVSWPPRPHHDEDGEWLFSFVISVTVQTIPFRDDFRLHVRTGVRRWRTGGAVPMPYRTGVSVVLAHEDSWLRGAPPTDRLSVSRMIKDYRTQTNRWLQGGPEGMLSRLSLARSFPDPEVLRQAPDTWIDETAGLRAAVVHSTHMGEHGVGAGLMARDRAPLNDWIVDALVPFLRRVPDLRPTVHSTVPLNLPKTANSAWPQERKDAFKAEQVAKRSTALRCRLSELLAGEPLILEARWQHPRTRDALVAQLADVLGLEGSGGDGIIRAWQSAELSVQLHLTEAGEIVSPLEFASPKPRRATLSEAIKCRRNAVRSECAGDGRSGVLATVVEIGHAKSFLPLTDPKFAVRLGFADAGRLTKFVQVPSGKYKNAGAKSVTIRAAQAWRDVFRQMGTSVVPVHSLSGFPEDLEYVALWMVKRRADGPTGKRQTVPIAIKVDQNGFATGFDRRSGRWIPHRQLLLDLARSAEIPGQFDQEEPDTTWVPDLATQQADAENFVKAMLYSLRDRRVLLLTHAQNSRPLWTWLQNGRLEKDLLGFSSGPGQDIGLYGDRLCHVRVRDKQQDETSQWYAIDQQDGHHGIATGVWLDADHQAGDRVFLSSAEKADTAKNAAVDASKLATRINKVGAVVIDTGRNASNPGLLEITVAALPTDGPGETEQWAALVHQLRRAPDRRSTLALPLPLHLARKTQMYLLPHDDEASSEAPGGN